MNNFNNLPGFTAAAALTQSRKTYRPTGSLHSGFDQSVLPQAKKGGSPTQRKCEAGCYGSYIGGLLACAFDKYPEICRSNNENVYSRCKSRCGGVLGGGGLGGVIA